MALTSVMRNTGAIHSYTVYSQNGKLHIFFSRSYPKGQKHNVVYEWIGVISKLTQTSQQGLAVAETKLVDILVEKNKHL